MAPATDNAQNRRARTIVALGCANKLKLANNKARTSQALAISEKTLYNKLYRYAGRVPRKEGEAPDDDAVAFALARHSARVAP